jgi:endonuclease YncB( thermonuclease family)
MQTRPITIKIPGALRSPSRGTVKARQRALAVLAVCVIAPALAWGGDSLYAKVKEVRSAAVVTLDYGKGEYVVRIAGIDAPKEGPAAQQAQEFISKLILGKDVRLRFEMRNKQGEMVGRLFTDDSEKGGTDVAVELLRAGLAKRQTDYDYKYGELSAAENEAQKERRGLWK